MNSPPSDVARRNNVHVRGAGPVTLYFAHGFGCDQNMWRLLVPRFEDRFRVVLFDLVGSGLSDLGAYREDKYATLHGHAADLLDIVAATGGGPAVFIGHSVSTMIGMLAGQAQPGVFSHHVMVAPSPCYVDDGDYVGGFTRADIDSLLETLEGNYLGWASNMAPAIMGAPGQPQLAVELTNSFCRTDPEIAKHFARVTFLSDHRDALPRHDAPTLILQCTDDFIAPPTVGHYMHRMLPSSTLAMIANTGHCPHLSAADDSFRAIDAFLRPLVA